MQLTTPPRGLEEPHSERTSQLTGEFWKHHPRKDQCMKHYPRNECSSCRMVSVPCIPTAESTTVLRLSKQDCANANKRGREIGRALLENGTGVGYFFGAALSMRFL